MAGHSKWSNIKARKGKMDAARGNIFTKLGKELAVAVKSGGPDPETNPRLRDAIAKAKQNNMPNDTIKRSIKRASGALESVNYEEITYEGYAAGGVAIIVETLTDNRNRTAGDLRHIFDKYGGALGQTGCVSYLFKRMGIIIVEKGNLTEDDMLMISLEAGANDMLVEDEVYEIYTSAQDLESVRQEIIKSDLKILSSSLDLIPDINIDPPENNIKSIQTMLDKLDENDDVKNIYHNANLPEQED